MQSSAAALVESASLVHELQTTYSSALYGAPGRLNLSEIRVCWPAGLSSHGRRALRTAVSCGTPVRRNVLPAGSAPRLYVDNLYAFVNSVAVWVQQPPERFPEPGLPHTWIEVTHCFYYSWPEHIHQGTPIHFFHAPGSGVSINLGRSLVLRHDRYGWQNVGRVHRYFNDKAHRPLAQNVTSLLRQLRKLLRTPTLDGIDTPDARRHAPIDSVQFVGARNKNWGSERFTEVVMLRWGTEMSFLPSHLSRLRYG